MRTLILSIMCGALVFASSCSRKAETGSDSPENPPVITSDAASPKPTVIASDDSEKKLPALKGSEHYAWGVRLPQGMIPTKSPGAGVVRFEGTHGNAIVKSYLVEQLVKDFKMERSADGKAYLITEAKPLFSRNGAEDLGAGDTLSIRIFSGSLGGAAVDISRNIPLVRAPAGGTRTSSYTGPSTSFFNRESTAPSAAPRLESPQARRRSTMITLEKMARGEELTAEDYQSPYFTEE